MFQKTWALNVENAKKLREIGLKHEVKDVEDLNLDPVETEKGVKQFSVKKLDKTGRERKEKNGSSMRVPVSTLAAVKGLPAMKAWVNTVQNVAVYDEQTLSHIPFVAGMEDQTGLITDLIDYYEGHVHGLHSDDSFLNNRMLYDLMQALLRNPLLHFFFPSSRSNVRSIYSLLNCLPQIPSARNSVQSDRSGIPEQRNSKGSLSKVRHSPSLSLFILKWFFGMV